MWVAVVVEGDVLPYSVTEKCLCSRVTVSKTHGSFICSITAQCQGMTKLSGPNAKGFPFREV